MLRSAFELITRPESLVSKSQRVLKNNFFANHSLFRPSGHSVINPRRLTFQLLSLVRVPALKRVLVVLNFHYRMMMAIEPLGTFRVPCIFCGLPKTFASIHFETVLSSINNSDFCLFTGDVPPISMSPISQSQFIPLGEVLLLAISAMNSAHKSVTQETLTEHLQTCFPGNTIHNY